MKVHDHNLRLGIVIGTTLLLFLASALTVALQTRRATQTTVSSNQNSGNQNVGEDYGRKVPTRAKATTVKSPGTKPPATTQTEPKPAADANDPGGQRSGTGTTPPQKPPSGWTPPAQGPQWEAPKLVADKYVVQLGEPVKFSLDELSDYVRTHYSIEIDYGDGSPTETLDQNRQVLLHPFRSVQRFKVSATGKPSHSDAPQGEKQLEPIRITVEKVKLSVDKPKVEVGVVVTLTTKPLSNDSNVLCRFVFGDGEQTDWQKSNEATHAYAIAPQSEPRVELAFADSTSIVSDQDSEKIDVTQPPRGTLKLNLPGQANAGESVNLSAEFPNDGQRHFQYRFLVDQKRRDEWTNWQDANTISHPYTDGDYEAVAQVGVLINGKVAELDTSDPQSIHVLATQISVTPSPTFSPQPTREPTPDKEWPPKILIDILIVLVAVLVLVIITAISVGSYKWAKSAFAPKPTFVAFSGVGNAAIDKGRIASLVEFEVHLDPNVGQGFYYITTSEPSLIGAQRSHP